jgi:hypothetical protein
MKRTACLLVALSCLSSFSALADTETPPPAPAAQSGTSQTPPAPTDGTTQPAPEEKKVQDPAPAPGGTAQPDPKEDEVVCKRVESASGSRIGTKRVCLTVREWRDYKEPQ